MALDKPRYGWESMRSDDKTYEDKLKELKERSETRRKDFERCQLINKISKAMYHDGTKFEVLSLIGKQLESKSTEELQIMAQPFNTQTKEKTSAKKR